MRLNHYIFSNTLHGTHSPFVYKFLEDVVYQPNIKPKNKKEQLIQRIFNSREKGKVFLFDESLHSEDLITEYHLNSENADNQTIFIIENIRKNEVRFNTWKSIASDSKNNISIDLFDIGLLFFDQKKPKEHFKIYY